MYAQRNVYTYYKVTVAKYYGILRINVKKCYEPKL